MLAPQRILHPTDFSPTSGCAFQLASTLAGNQGALLVLLHVTETTGPMITYGQASVRVLPTTQWTTLLNRLHGLRADAPGVRVEIRLTEGDPACEILRFADELSCDLIVMGNRGGGNPLRSSLGRVAESVMLQARCPVVALAAPTSDLKTQNAPPSALGGYLYSGSQSTEIW